MCGTCCSIRRAIVLGLPLGQAVFDNADCTTSEPQLGVDEAQLVADIRFMEEEFSCAVDTSASALQYFDPGQMAGWSTDVPVPAEYGSGCFGYHGAPIPLFARRDKTSGVVAQIAEGTDFGTVSFVVGGWTYVTGFNHSADVAGWRRSGRSIGAISPATVMPGDQRVLRACNAALIVPSSR